MTRTLLLFDIDGTLLVCRGRGLRAMHLAMQRVFGVQPVEVEVLPHGKTDPMLFDELAAGYALPEAQLASQLTTLQEVYVGELEQLLRETGACEIKPGARELIENLAARPDIALGLVSGNLERTARLKLAAVDLSRHFATGAFGSDSRHRADLVALALRRCGAHCDIDFDPTRTWVIGDTPDDVASGRAHGARTLGVATGRFSRRELQDCGAHAVLDDFADTALVLDALCLPR